MGNQRTCEAGSGEAPCLQISCSTPELHRRAQSKTAVSQQPRHTSATPVIAGGAPSTSTDAARKLIGPRAEIERFFAFVSPEPMSGCWLWTGAIQSKGYGFFTLANHSMVLAHRYSYALAKPFDPYLQIDHACRNRACVNPAHLDQVSPSENMLRRYRAARGEPVRQAVL